MPAPISVPAGRVPAQNGQQADHVQSLMLLQSKLAELQKIIPKSANSTGPGSKLVADSPRSASSQIDKTLRPNPNALPEASLQSLMSMSSQLAELGKSIGAPPAGRTAPIPAAKPFTQSASAIQPPNPQMPPPISSPKDVQTEYIQSLIAMTYQLAEIQKSLRSEPGVQSPGRLSLPPLPPLPPLPSQMQMPTAASANLTASANPSMEESLQSLKLMSSKLDELQKSQRIGTPAERTTSVVRGPVAESRPSMPSQIAAMPRSTAMPAFYETMFASLNSLSSALAKMEDSLGALPESASAEPNLSTGSLSPASSQIIDMRKQGAMPARAFPESRPEMPSSLPVSTDQCQPESGSRTDSQTLTSPSNRLAELEKQAADRQPQILAPAGLPALLAGPMAESLQNLLSLQSELTEMRKSLSTISAPASPSSGLPAGPLPSQPPRSSQNADLLQLTAGSSGRTTPECRPPSQSMPPQAADMQRQIVAPADLAALLEPMAEPLQKLKSLQSEMAELQKLRSTISGRSDPSSDLSAVPFPSQPSYAGPPAGSMMLLSSAANELQNSMATLANRSSTGAGSLPSLPPLPPFPPQFSKMPNSVAASDGTMPQAGPFAESQRCLLDLQSKVVKMHESFAELAASLEEREKSLNREFTGIKRGAHELSGDESDPDMSSSFDRQRSETTQIESRSEDRTLEKTTILNTPTMIRTEVLGHGIINAFLEPIKSAIHKALEDMMEDLFPAIPNIFPENASEETRRESSAGSSYEQDEEQFLDAMSNFEVPEPMKSMLDDFAVALREKLFKSTQEVMADKLQCYQQNFLEATKRALSEVWNDIEDPRDSSNGNVAVQDRWENNKSISDNSNSEQSDDDALQFGSDAGVSDLMETMSNLLEMLSSFRVSAGDNRASNRQIPCNCPDCSFVDSAPRKLR